MGKEKEIWWMQVRGLTGGGRERDCADEKKSVEANGNTRVVKAKQYKKKKCLQQNSNFVHI